VPCRFGVDVPMLVVVIALLGTQTYSFVGGKDGKGSAVDAYCHNGAVAILCLQTLYLFGRCGAIDTALSGEVFNQHTGLDGDGVVFLNGFDHWGFDIDEAVVHIDMGTTRQAEYA
jgi:hypothetical protein